MAWWVKASGAKCDYRSSILGPMWRKQRPPRPPVPPEETTLCKDTLYSLKTMWAMGRGAVDKYKGLCSSPGPNTRETEAEGTDI